ncbi:MAG: hypothetical protein J7M38_02480, partial [Armatimonadetes bacterium]|nr:hypothetical protein [Armatimonadota bacterium]
FIESIAPDGSESEFDGLLPDPNKYEVNLQLPSGLGVYRNFQRTEIELNDAVFNTGIQEVATTGASLQLGSQTSLAFTREDRQVRDVLSQMRESHSTTGMQFTQGFGGGASSGQITLYRAMRTDESLDRGELRTEIQRMGFQTGLGAGSSFQAGWETQESQEPGRLSQSGYHGDLKLALSGGEGLAHFDYLERLIEGQQFTHRQYDLVAPFSTGVGDLRAEHHFLQETTDTSERTTRKTLLVLPLGMISEGAQASYVEDATILNDVLNQKSTLNVGVPMSLFGHDSRLEHIATETIAGAAVTEQTTTRLSAQFAGGTGLVERYEASVPIGEDKQLQRRLRLELPTIPITHYFGLAAGQTRSEVVGEYESRISHLDLTAKPLRPLDVRASYRYYDHPDGRETKDRSVQTSLALSSTTTLHSSIVEAERLDADAATVRHIELQRVGHSEGDIAVRVGYTDYGVQYEDEPPAVLAQLSVGSNNRFAVSATYTEYDTTKMVQLPEPSTAVEIRAGDPSHLAVRAGFTEQASRVEPERSLGVAAGVMGGSLRLTYINNPLDPTNKVVMVSDLYELGFQRTVFGSVGLDLGLKYWIPDGEEGARTFYRLQLDGGSEEAGGKIALSYLSGHFVPYPTSGQPPASLLDLSYYKRWGDAGRLVITVSREEPPVMSVGLDDNIEAELKYQMRF